MKFPGTARHEIIIEPTFPAWRDSARALLESGVPPERVDLHDSQAPQSGSLFGGIRPEIPQAHPEPVRIGREFIERARFVASHRSPERWNLLYRVLWRLRENRHLLRIEIDEDVAAFRQLEHQVKRDLHKMHAFVRFRLTHDDGGEHYVAWYEPAHAILEFAAPFFAQRFAVTRWSILTPDGSVSWHPEDRRLRFGPAVPRERAPQGDAFEQMWRTYYTSIFNPARTNLAAMRAEMPVRYWKNLPEVDALPGLIVEAGKRVDGMVERQSKASALPFVPPSGSLPVLQKAARHCEGCALFRCATQAVFGCGPEHAPLMLVGEQPGDEEDRRGQPFVGPAGRLLDDLMAEAGLERDHIYMTNAVKHFKFAERGKRRLHESPRLSEIFACRPWLLAELEAVQPKVVVCLGASAARSLLGANFALLRERGKVLTSPHAGRVVATWHPSAILRAQDPLRGASMRTMLVADLRLAAEAATA